MWSDEFDVLMAALLAKRACLFLTKDVTAYNSSVQALSDAIMMKLQLQQRLEIITYTGWTTGGEEEIVEFYKNAVGVCQAPVLVNAVEKAVLLLFLAPNRRWRNWKYNNGETPVVVTLTAITHTTHCTCSTKGINSRISLLFVRVDFNYN